MHGASNPWITFGIIVVIWLVILYFMVIIPQKRKSKKQKNLIDDLKIGDKILTIGGIKGELVSKNEETSDIQLKIDKGVKITLTKGSIYKKIED